MTRSESDLDARLRSLGDELDRRSRSHHTSDQPPQRSRGPLVAAGILAAVTIVGLVAVTDRDPNSNEITPSASTPQLTGTGPDTPPSAQPGDATVAGAMTFESMPAGFSLTNANPDALADAFTTNDFASQTRIYTADAQRPDTAATLAVTTGPVDDSGVLDESPEVTTITVNGVEASLYDDPRTGGRTLTYLRDDRYYAITGYRVTDDQIIAAAAHTAPAGPLHGNYGAVVDPAGLPEGVDEVQMGGAWFERWLIFKDALSNPVPSTHWESETASLWVFGLQSSPESLPMTRIGWTTVTDTTVHGQPAFIVTADSDPGFRGVNWIEGGITYLVGSRGLDDTQLLDQVEQLRPATADEWTDMLTASDTYLNDVGASPVTTVSVTAEPSLMSISQDVVVGEEFTVAFSGGLRDERGGYLWVKTSDGSSLALLRSDGNTDIPMGYELDVTVATMLTDSLRGGTSTFTFPAELPAGAYILCTALGDEECLPVDVRAA